MCSLCPLVRLWASDPPAAPMKAAVFAKFRVQPVQNSGGFSLLEVIIACSLVAILLAMAIPSYRQYIMRTHRAEAIEQLLSAVACQQRIYSAEFSFDTRRCLPDVPDGNYEFRFEPDGAAGVTAFTVFAEPAAAQQADRCGSLSLDHTGLRTADGDAGRLNACWQSR